LATNASTSGESSGRLDVRPDRGFKLKPVVTSTPEELAAALGLSAAEAKEWQVQHVLLKRLKTSGDT